LSIEGVDIATGMSRVGGSPDRYRELLRVFFKDAENGFALLETNPDAGRLPSFITFVHALKSGLANIGANALSRLAAGLEQAGRDKDMGAIQHGLPVFREALARLMKRIHEATALTPSPSGEAEREGVSAALLREAVTELQDALEAKDAGRLDAALTKLQNLSLPAGTRVAVTDIAQYILFGDFKKAAAAVDILLQQGIGCRQPMGDAS